jgi:two-component system response regulator MprA
MADQQVLVVEDDPQTAAMLQRALVYEGYRVTVAADGPSALQIALRQTPDLVVLDWMLPGLDGLEVCRRLRTADEALPILMLTAREEIADRVRGLQGGADDYVAKPFALDELLARIQALLRRAGASAKAAQILRFADLQLDPAARQVWRDGREITLSPREFDLLDLLMRHPGHVLSRERILDTIWNYDFGGQTNVVDVYIGYLRQKLEAWGGARLIQTVRGVGFVLREQAEGRA